MAAKCTGARQGPIHASCKFGGKKALPRGSFDSDMALEGISFALGVIPELRHQLNSIRTRIVSFTQGPTTFLDLSTKLNGMVARASEIESILNNHPSAVPHQTSSMFRDRLETVTQCIQSLDPVMDQLSRGAFSGSSSDKRKRMRLMFQRVSRTDSISDKMAMVEARIKEASGIMQALSCELSLCVKLEMINVKLEAKSNEPIYMPDGSTPALSHTTCLSYDAKDSDGYPETPEGNLKQSVLSSGSSDTVTAAAGVLNPAYGVVGMAGVGKTVALQGLAFDKDIRARFPDGVHYMSLGYGATLETAIGEIGKIMCVTGAAAIAHKVESSSSLPEAVEYAVAWFRSKTCLFLVDDLWPSEACETGFLNDLRQLVRGNPKSRMAITTRNVSIALTAGAPVDFGARDPLGPVSKKIFMKYATASLRNDDIADRIRGPRDSVKRILSICGGLPIALSVTGCSVAFLRRLHPDFDRACDAYAAELENMKLSLVDKHGPNGTSLRAGIVLSLQYLDRDFVQWKRKYAPNIEYSIRELYTALCVLQNQAWIPASVLCRLWKLDEDCATYVMKRFCGMSLATVQYRKNSKVDEAGLTLHDLHLAFCQVEAEEMQTKSIWHALLQGYFDKVSNASATPILAGSNILEGIKSGSVSPRRWWSDDIPDDGYIHANLARHMACSNLGPELTALLLDARWIGLRRRIGGILALNTDFELCIETISQGQVEGRLGMSSQDIMKSVRIIQKAIQLSWGIGDEGQKAIQFQLRGRLYNLAKENEIVAAFCRTVEKNSFPPYLLPVNQFFPSLNNAQIAEFSIGNECGECGEFACSPCGRYIAFANGKHIAVAIFSTCAILKLLNGHSSPVRAIQFDGSKKIVSGSQDKSIIVWEWEAPDSIVQVLNGHRDSVSSVAVASDGEKIFSGSYDHTLRIWDAANGTQNGEYSQGNSISSIALHTDNRTVALGLVGGTLKVFDSRTGATVFADNSSQKRNLCCVAFGPRSRCLASGSLDGQITLRDSQTWKIIGESYEGHARPKDHTVTLPSEEKQWRNYIMSISFHPDGHQVVSSSEDGSIQLWDVVSRRVLAQFPSGQTLPQYVSFSHDGKRLISVTETGVVRIWKSVPDIGVDTRDLFRTAAPECSENRVSTAPQTEGADDCDSGCLVERHKGPVKCVAFSNDGHQVVSGSDDRTLRLWDTDTTMQIGVPFEGHSDAVECVSFNHDGRRVLSGSWDSTIRIWDARTQAQIGAVLRGHEESVSHVAESSDGHYIVSEDNYQQTFIWTLDRREIVWKIKQGVADVANEIGDEQAQRIIRDCPNASISRPLFQGEIEDRLYMDQNGKSILIAVLPGCSDWSYHVKRNLLATGEENGAVGICRLIVE